ncbi:PLP-dependent transferase [Nesterenkonia pannonica]|uniref:PLP-dependent transferase n=1 Tax=Nesterenkonia pannonica TaxID=1548602 RepID=UPI002164A9DC|nr:PLP-dependent transferase [Nesterenkonia pannonica]
MTEFETRLLQAAADTDAPTPALEQTLAALESGHQARAVAHGPDALALAVLHVAEPGTSVLVTPSMFAGNRRPSSSSCPATASTPRWSKIPTTPPPGPPT